MLFLFQLFPQSDIREGKSNLNKDPRMYALVEIAGKQYKAVEGESVLVDLLGIAAGETYETDKVLAIVDGDNARFGTPYIDQEGREDQGLQVPQKKGLQKDPGTS